MGKLFRRKEVEESYDRENLRPVIRSSICNGERIAGFRDIHTGRLTEVMLIRDDRDLEEFRRWYDIPAEEIKKEW